MEILDEFEDLFEKPVKERPKISLLIPFQSDNHERKRVFKWVLKYWQHELPDAEIVIGRSRRFKAFCKTEALNNAAGKATGRVLVTLDADTYMPGSILDRCADRILEELDKHLWYVPYRNLYRLKKEITEEILESDPTNPLRLSSPPPKEDVEGGSKSSYGHRYGAMVMIFPREALDVLGCFDERFKGWGGEDVAFLRALDTLYCVVPETKILTTDLTWVGAGTLKADDKLIGIDDLSERDDVEGKGSGRIVQLKESKVEFVERATMPCFRVITDRGETIVSACHSFVWKQDKDAHKYPQWKNANELVAGSVVQWTTTPWETDSSRDAGYLAGVFDGEGNVGPRSVKVTQNKGRVLDRTCKLLLDRGFKIKNYNKDSEIDCQDIYINGGHWEYLRFLGSIRPERLLEKSALLWEGKEVTSKGPHAVPGSGWATVQSVEAVGEREVIVLYTSTQTFIADGFSAHNGKHKTTNNDILHLWHPFIGKNYKTRQWKGQKGPNVNARLAMRYHRATRNPTQMRELVDEGCLSRNQGCLF